MRFMPSKTPRPIRFWLSWPSPAASEPVTWVGVFILIAESDLNDARLVRPPQRGGYGLDAMWSDDYHHAVHSLLTGEREGYYQDFGRLEDLAEAYRSGFTYSGQYSPYRDRRHGNSPADLEPWRFVVCCQNHDQVGNRARGERLSSLLRLGEPEAGRRTGAALTSHPAPVHGRRVR